MTLIEAHNAPQLLAARGRFSLVEGKVLSVREAGATIYLNFGRRWSEALTRHHIETAMSASSREPDYRRSG